VECTTNANNCTVCPPGKYVVSATAGTCASCSSNCFNCTSNSSCLTCNKGYILNGSVCIGCSIFCSSCELTNVTLCTSCDRGLVLVNSQCVPCPLNCLDCRNLTFCDTCLNGFVANDTGACVTQCQLPCVTCMSGQPSNCTSCPSGATLSSGVCSFDLTCNSTSNCTYCGQVFNYYLVPTVTGNICLNCSTISNCIQCNAADPTKCLLCTNGYYPNAIGACVQCSTNCLTCNSATVCTYCASGYTLLAGFNEGLCLTCTVPCATCWGSPTHCLTCATGYAQVGERCVSNNRFTFTFVLIG
jgi:hypothetical protein